MSSTLNPACPLCGLRFASKPLLEPHIREDHRPRRRMQPGRADAEGAGVSSAAAGRPSRLAVSGAIGQDTAGPAARVTDAQHQHAVGYPPGQTEGSPAAGPNAGVPAESAAGTAAAKARAG